MSEELVESGSPDSADATAAGALTSADHGRLPLLN